MSAEGGGHEDAVPPDDIDNSEVADKARDANPKPLGWQLVWQPGLESYLRNAIGPIVRQLDDINRISEVARAAMPRIGPPKFDVPSFEMPKVDLSTIRIAPDLGRSLIDIDKALELIREAMASMVDWSKLARSFIDPNLIERIRESVARHMPPNWSLLEDWLDAATFIDETGWPIIWLPSAEAVVTLLQADLSERETTLLALSRTIVDDAEACAAEIGHDERRFVADCVVEVAGSIRDGRHRAAQALAASVLTELIQGILGHDELGDARQQYAEPWEEKSIQVLRFALITSAIPKALTRFYRPKGDPVPQSFNHHAVAHGASPVQFTPTNALVSLLLVTALARDLQALYDEDILSRERLRTDMSADQHLAYELDQMRDDLELQYEIWPPPCTALHQAISGPASHTSRQRSSKGQLPGPKRLGRVRPRPPRPGRPHRGRACTHADE